MLDLGKPSMVIFLTFRGKNACQDGLGEQKWGGGQKICNASPGHIIMNINRSSQFSKILSIPIGLCDQINHMSFHCLAWQQPLHHCLYGFHNEIWIIYSSKTHF